MEIILADQNTCTGCGACFNSCHKNAIKMIPDEEGFIQPKIDKNLCVECGMCEKACPVLHFEKKENAEIPEVFAVRGPDEVRKVSSSGGVFSLIAQWIFSQGGAVCGAAFLDDMQLKHIVVENEEDLAQLRGSKYLQSDTQDIYQQVIRLLKMGRKVLFTGTPCQVAALNRLAGSDDNLYTIDIFCHGVPSQQVFDDYLSEISKGQEIKTVKFRDKQFGWACNHIKIDFKEESQKSGADEGRYDQAGRLIEKENQGNSYVGNDKTDAYEAGFLRNLFLRRSCEDCKFSEMPRHGDISIGDYWGISKVDASQNDGKGTSVVLVNNLKGKELLTVLQKSAVCKEMHVDVQKMPNRVHAACVFNKNRERFFALRKTKSLSESVYDALHGHYDIGLVSNYCAPNFGGALTHYALYHLLEDMGYSTLMIEAPQSGRRSRGTCWDVMKRCFKELIYPAYAMSKAYPDKEQMRVLNSICDTFVVGSDQLYQYSLYMLMDKFVSLDWVEGRKKKIAIAASFGHGHVFGDPKVHAELAFWLSRFDFFSVREASAVDICKDTYGREVDQILDPVFLVDPKHYDTLIEKADCCLPEHYVGFYILDPSEEKKNIIQEIASSHKMNMTGFSEFNASEKYRMPLDGCNAINYKGEERLKVIKNSELFVTDSFHGTCLAIIMKKNFVTFLNSRRGASRFYSILQLFGLENRLVTSYQDFESRKKLFEKPIDWDTVYEKLEKEKVKSLLWIEKALTTNKLNKNETYDILMDRICQVETQIHKKESEIKELNDQIAILQRKTSGVIQKIKEGIRFAILQRKARWVIQKIKGGIQCYKDNGLFYTWKHFWKKVKRKLKE